MGKGVFVAVGKTVRVVGVIAGVFVGSKVIVMLFVELRGVDASRGERHPIRNRPRIKKDTNQSFVCFMFSLYALPGLSTGWEMYVC